MKGILIIAMAVFSLSVVSNSQENRLTQVPCGKNGTQAEANACAHREYQKAEADMNRVFDRLLGELAGYSSKDQQKLRRAQEAWLQYRDATCDSESSIYEGGTIHPAVYYACLASVTRERGRRLGEFVAVTRQ
jgi:uncharacterized protein YecT (DUF1311 family)